MKRFFITIFLLFIFSGISHADSQTTIYIDGVGYIKMPFSSNIWVEINSKKVPLQAYEFSGTEMVLKNADAADLSNT